MFDKLLKVTHHVDDDGKKSVSVKGPLVLAIPLAPLVLAFGLGRLSKRFK